MYPSTEHRLKKNIDPGMPNLYSVCGIFIKDTDMCVCPYKCVKSTTCKGKYIILYTIDSVII